MYVARFPALGTFSAPKHCIRQDLFQPRVARSTLVKVATVADVKVATWTRVADLAHQLGFWVLLFIAICRHLCGDHAEDRDLEVVLVFGQHVVRLAPLDAEQSHQLDKLLYEVWRIIFGIFMRKFLLYRDNNNCTWYFWRLFCGSL